MDSMPNSTGNQSCLDTALLALDLGLSPLPPLEDGSKAPLFELINGEWTWKPYQTTPATAEHVHQWYARGLTGVGLACGVDDLECLDFDNPDTYKDYLEAAWATGLNDLVLRIRAGYEEWTPSGGAHWLYRCPVRKGNTKLAQRADKKALIETRGQGGFIIIAPSNGKVHPRGGAYRLISGSLKTIPTVMDWERGSTLEPGPDV